MKILHVIANIAPRYGGPSQAILGMTSSLVEQGHDVTVFTTNQDSNGKLAVPTDKTTIKDGVKIRYFNIQKPKFFGTSLGMAVAIKKEIQEYDIVHIHSLYLFHGLITGHYCRKFNVPYIVRPHGTLDPFIYKRHRKRKKILEFLFENKNIKYASALHYTTEEEMLLASSVVPHDRGIIVPNGLHLKDYHHTGNVDNILDEYPQLKGKKVILFFSRLNFKKGLDILIESYANLAEKREDVHLLIVGPDNEGYGENIKRWINEKNLAHKITLTGLLKGEMKLKVFSIADVFVLPSRSENFGVSVIESMAMGVPIIISDKVNIYREVLSNNAGEVISCNSEELTNKIQMLMDNPIYANEIALNARDMVENNYQWKEIGKKLERSYKNILS